VTQDDVEERHTTLEYETQFDEQVTTTVYDRERLRDRMATSEVVNL
jgi:hypothetical protein